jgi:cytoskeletal protein RodZ
MKQIFFMTFIISFALFYGCQSAAYPSAAPVSKPPSTATTQPAPTAETAAPQVQTQTDSKFSLEIIEPQDSSVVKASTVKVRGTTLPDAEVRVNDQFVIVDAAGAFTAVVSLEAGPNSVEVTATDTAGNEEFRLITVMYLP